MTTSLTNPRRTAEHPRLTRRSWRGAGYATHVWVLTGQAVRVTLSDPRTVVIDVLQPLVMVVLFSQVFGTAMTSSVATQSDSYINYLVPAILVTTGIGSAQLSGAIFIRDMKNGMLTRFRAMPIRLSSVLVARSLADLSRTTAQLAVLLLVSAALFGYAPAGGVSGVVVALLLALTLSWSLTWIFLAIATWVRKAEAMNSIGSLTMLPLMFGSSAFVPPTVMPDWLRVIAQLNPLTYAVDAARNVSLALPAGSSVLSALAASALLFLFGFISAAKGFRRPLHV